MIVFVVFGYYGNMIFEQARTLKSQVMYLQFSHKSIEDANKLLKDDAINLQNKIRRMKIEGELKKKEMISNYIIKNFRRTPPSVAREISEAIIQVSKEKNIAVPILIGIIEVESGFNPFSVSKVGARGLMQVMPEWIGKLDTKLDSEFDLHDITTGIQAGTDVFNIHLKENNGDVSKGLYYYVNKDNTYIMKVYVAIGKYLTFKSE
jgi:soluble lytic murein transglycosylase-like protein